jgi:methylglyoxal synthase
MAARKRIALIAHDNKKSDLIEWVAFNKTLLAGHELFATRTTGRLIADRLGLDVVVFRSGPLGGDQQIGARITDGAIDFLIFFWDPLEPHPHDPDVRALLRVASPLMDEAYQRLIPPYDGSAEDGYPHPRAPVEAGDA